MPAITIQELLKKTQAISSIDLLVKTCIDLGYKDVKKKSGNHCLITTKEEVLNVVSNLMIKFETFSPDAQDSGIQIGKYTIGVEQK